MPLKIKPRTILFLGAIFPPRVFLFLKPQPVGSPFSALAPVSQQRGVSSSSCQGGGKVSLPESFQGQLPSPCWAPRRWCRR